jgi:hypothetical protein
MLVADHRENPPPPGAQSENGKAYCNPQENIMSTVSLARIMYGANEESHNGDWMKHSGFSSQTLSSAKSGSTDTAQGPVASSNDSVLHKVWLALSRRA